MRTTLNAMRVLVVENDDRVARALQRTLRAEGFVADRAVGLATATQAIRDHPYQLVLVDLGLDDGDGVDLIRRLRDRDEIGVIAVTARGAEQHRVRGLRAGADDYLVKPFGAGELLARIEAVSRRLRIAQAQPQEQGTLDHGALIIDLDRHQVSINGEPVTLTPKQFDVLTLLARAAGTALTRGRILDQVWRSTAEANSRSLDTHMTSLRAKLGDHVRITTIRGVGYRLESEGSD